MAGHPHSHGPLTLAVDCGGTGIKACLLDPGGAMVSERLRVRTPYPCPPDVLLAAVGRLAADLPGYDRVSVGLPGLVRRGIVLATPHYVTAAGPFTAVLPELVAQWSGFDVAAALSGRLGRPCRAANDAEVQGLAVIEGRGYEVMLTIGTGLGFGQFLDGVPLPKLELSQHPFRKGETYDQQLGHHARREIGARHWSRRVVRAVGALQPVLWWDRLWIGGGGARHLNGEALAALTGRATIVPNTAGLLGGVRLWDPAG